MPEQRSLAVPIARFNFSPILYAHDSWFPEEMKKVMAMDPERRCAPARKDLSSYLLRYYDIDQAFDFDFSWANKRVALLSPARLARFFVALGLALNSETLQRIVKGSERRAIKEFVDAADYDAAVRNPFLFILKSSAFKVFRAPLPDDGDWREWTRSIGDMGLKLSAHIFRRQSDSFATRLCLKLPKDKSEIYRRACQEDFQCKPSLAEMIFSHSFREVVGEDLQAFADGSH